ncbi:hypothetical protein N7468_002778 [Penicillium chermesinum]|uniref:Neutral protease 2 n=1 Tax=Penicillium chermesinum TaxID=63820 RepID=A0A9W9TXY3_9EURO|nr:uncharacterized protein N7468_002778 [Penicillium chermesinum]KAJ5247795.1 hypothetical protein N7468_002778 [Penicillium chermesinum]
MILIVVCYWALILQLHVSAIPLNLNGVPTLEVKLSQTDNTLIRARVRNTGKEDVTFVHLNFFRDPAPVQKVDIYRGSMVPLRGIRQHFRLDGLTPEVLTTLHAGEIFEDEFDLAETSDLGHGGLFTLRSSGSVSLVNNGAVSGYLPYFSEELTIQVNGTRAFQGPKTMSPLNWHTKETCTDSQRTSILGEALGNVVSLANAAANAAQSGSADKFVEYFKTDDAKTRSIVASRLLAVAKEADSRDSGATTYYCSDVLGFCESNVLAYTLPSQNIIANCDIWYSYLPDLATGCHNQDRATTALHEFTHAPGVYSPGTQDLGYGYSAIEALNSSQAVLNADTYALYANGMSSLVPNGTCHVQEISKNRLIEPAIYLGC